MRFNLFVTPVISPLAQKLMTRQAACRLMFSVSMLFLSLGVAAGKAANTVGLPQSIKSAEPSNTDINYSLPAASSGAEIIDDDTSAKIKVSSIRIVEIIERQGDGTYHEVLFVDDVMATMVRERLAQQGGLMRFSQLQTLAFELNQYLKVKADYLLSAMYMPAQKVQEGVVKFALLKGKLGVVRVEGNQLYDTKALTALFDGQVDKVVKKGQTEENLLRLQDLPGLSASGIFSPGEKLGYTDLILHVNKERRYDVQLFSDNYGSDFTGNIRSGISVSANNLLGLKDRLNLQLYATEGVDSASVSGSDIDCCKGSIGYEWAMDRANRFRLGSEVYTANYDVGDVDELLLSDFGFNGKTRQYKVYGNYQLYRSRSFNGTFGLALSHINAKSLLLNTLKSEDKVSVADFSYRFDFTDKLLGGGTNFGNLQLSTGKLSEGRASQSRLSADNNFNKLNLSLNRALQLSHASRMLLRFNGQYTNDKLVGVQQISLGGPSSLRAYPTGAFLADKAVVASMDLYWSATDFFKPYLLVDYASARLVGVDNDANDKAHLGAYGFGMNWHYGSVSLDMTAARALGSNRSRATPISDGGRDAAGRNSTQIYASLHYDF